jgi:hypothetical protein
MKNQELCNMTGMLCERVLKLQHLKARTQASAFFECSWYISAVTRFYGSACDERQETAAYFGGARLFCGLVIELFQRLGPTRLELLKLHDLSLL